MEDYITEHTKLYDSLANEYEQRTDTLLPVTTHAVDLMSKYLKRRASILELGCGAGLAAALFSRKGFRITCIDISSKMLSFARLRCPNGEFIQGDFLDINFKNKFDGIFGMAFIHLFPKNDALEVLKKTNKLLKPGGILYIGTTKARISKEGWKTKDDYKEKHKRYRKDWTEPEFTQAITSSDFKIIDSLNVKDPFGKEWMDIVARRA